MGMKMLQVSASMMDHVVSNMFATAYNIGVFTIQIFS